MKTLYEQNPSTWENFKKNGKPSICEMAKHFIKPSSMDSALGMSNTVSKWQRGLNLGSTASELRAKEWLESQAQNRTPHWHAEVPASNPKATVTFLCMADPATAAKMQKIMALMGCEYVEM